MSGLARSSGNPMTTAGGASGRGSAGESGAHSFVVCAVLYLAVTAIVAAVHATAGLSRGWWLVAFLGLVGGISQILLGPGLFALARRTGAQAPAPRTARAQLLLWNAGTATVALADLVPSIGGVFAGSVLLLADLALFAAALRGVGSTARTPARSGVASYAFLLVFLAASVAVGAFLAYVRRG